MNGYYRSRFGAIGYTEQFQLWEGVVKDMSKSYLFGNDYSQRNSTGGDCEGQGTETILLILIGTFKPRRTLSPPPLS